MIRSFDSLIRFLGRDIIDDKVLVKDSLSKPRLTDAVSGKGFVSGTDYVAAFKYEIAGSADGP